MKAKLNAKFYIVSVLLLGAVVFVWYGIHFLNTNEILMEDNSPMDDKTKLLFTVLESLIALSWTLSLFVLIRQICFNQAFLIDESGIHNTVTAIILLAFIFVVPIKNIPFSAVKRFTEEDGVLTLYIDKNKVDTLPIFRVFVRKKYHLFSGFTLEKKEDIKTELEKYIKKDAEKAEV